MMTMQFFGDYDVSTAKAISLPIQCLTFQEAIPFSYVGCLCDYGNSILKNYVS